MLYTNEQENNTTVTWEALLSSTAHEAQPRRVRRAGKMARASSALKQESNYTVLPHFRGNEAFCVNVVLLGRFIIIISQVVLHPMFIGLLSE